MIGLVSSTSYALPQSNTPISGSSMQTNGQVGQSVPPPTQPMSPEDYNSAVKALSSQNQQNYVPPKNASTSGQPGTPAGGAQNNNAGTAPSSTTNPSGSNAPASNAPETSNSNDMNSPTNTTNSSTTSNSGSSVFGGPTNTNLPANQQHKKAGQPQQASPFTGFGTGQTNSTGVNNSPSQNSGGWNIKY